MNYYLKALSNYFKFSGRARRKEYWYFILFNFFFAIAFMILDNITGLAYAETGYGPLYGLYALAVIIPGLAVTVRRLHDVGKSGCMYFIVLIPLIGAIWLLVLLGSSGDRGHNKYGSDPKELERGGAFA
jgi:uncharacterized membrane protein YhaH (DUF805 family)